MGLLLCQLFQPPPEVLDRLERCLLNDSDHIAPGSMGEHVRKIQIALNRLSEGPGGENFDLKEDGIYGPKTAAAVQAFKNAPRRRILQPFQTSADNIVGKKTMKSLDDEMDILENEAPWRADPFVSLTPTAPPLITARVRPGPDYVNSLDYGTGNPSHHRARRQGQTASPREESAGGS
jgi:peptidoglycan hydrolase-like protein with peptidoglycan-binding domain